MSAYWLWPYLFAGALVYGGWWVFRVISSGWTAVHANRSVTKFSSELARAAGKEK